MSKRNLKDLFKRKKKINNGGNCNNHEDAQESLTCIYKITLVNEFFTKAIQTGGEVVSSSRAMQDFFDQSATSQFERGETFDMVITPSPSAKINKSNLSNIITADLSPGYDANNKFHTPISTSSPFTPNSINSGHQLWRKISENQVIAKPISKAVISKPIIVASHMSTQEVSRRAVTIKEDTRLPRTPEDSEHVLVRSCASQESLPCDVWHQDVSCENLKSKKRTSGGSASSFEAQDDPLSASSETNNFPFGQVRHVSGFAVKTKASGWKIIKAKQPSLNQFVSPKQININSPDASPLRTLLKKGDLGSQSSLPDSITTTTLDETLSYKPSALEKLIFGKAGENADSIISNSSSEEEDYFGPEACKSLEQEGDPNKGNLEYMESARGKRDAIIPMSQNSIPLEKTTYRRKGKASDLYLDLKGKSNLHTDSMPYTRTMLEEEEMMNNVSAFSFDDEEELQGEMQEINLDQGSDSPTSPLLTPISRQLAAIHKEAENVALLYPQEYGLPIESSKSDSHIEGNDRKLSAGIDWQSTEQRRLSAINTEAQDWQWKQMRRAMH